MNENVSKMKEKMYFFVCVYEIGIKGRLTSISFLLFPQLLVSFFGELLLLLCKFVLSKKKCKRIYFKVKEKVLKFEDFVQKFLKNVRCSFCIFDYGKFFISLNVIFFKKNTWNYKHETHIGLKASYETKA